MIVITPKIDVKKDYIQGLLFEMDYELAWLHLYMQNRDLGNIEKVKMRLKEIHSELKMLELF